MTTYITISDYLSQGGVMKEGQPLTYKLGENSNYERQVAYRESLRKDLLIRIEVIPAFKIEQLADQYIERGRSLLLAKDLKQLLQ